MFEMQASAGAGAAVVAGGLVFPAEAIDHHGEAARRGQEGEIGNLRCRVLQGGGDDREVVGILGLETQVAHRLQAFSRQISAPRAPSLASMRSKPRSRW